MRVALTCAVACGLLVACGEDAPPRTADVYCGEIDANIGVLNAPVIGSDAEIEATLDLYRRLSARAPLAVQPEWEQLVDALDLTASVDPADPSSAQSAADTMRAARPAIDRIVSYTATTCGVQLTPPAG